MQSNLKSAIRFDSMPMPRAYFTPEGFLRDRPVLTSCGIFEYTNPDGSVRRELRLPEDVFSPESLRSYKGSPVVLTHEAGLINKNNVAENQIGTVLSEGERSGDDVKAEIIIHDTDAMRSAGLKELSLGYNLDLDETPGVWNGQRYDAIQRNIRINHLALVREARAGEQARLNLDSRDQVNLLKGGKRMSKKIKRVPHADAVLTDEELDKALEEYDKKYGNNTDPAAQPAAQTDADDEEPVVEEEVVVEEPAPSDDVEEKVEAVKARRDRRDEEGDPEDVDSAMGMIAHQDEDIQSLLDIIDTLRARLDLGAAKTDADEEEEVPVEEEEVPVEEEEVQEDEVDDLDVLKDNRKDAEGEEEPEDEELLDDEDRVEMDADDEEELPPEDEDEFAEDSEDEEVPPEDEEEEFLEDGADCDEIPEKRMDSIDRLVNLKIALGELGDKVGIKGLARKPVRQAKIEIIRAVRPNARMDGKSDVYINEAFKVARDTIKSRSIKTTADQKKQMYSKKPATNMDSTDTGSSMAARDRMIAKYRK